MKNKAKIEDNKYCVIDENLSALGPLIIKRRAHLKMTQEDLAEKANLSRQSISNIELGKQKPSGQTILLLCQALGITPEELLIGAQEIKNSKQCDHRMIELEKRIMALPETKKNRFFEIVFVLFDGL